MIHIDTNGYKMYTNGYILIQMDTKCVQMDTYGHKLIQMDTSIYQFKSTNGAETPLLLLLIVNSDLINSIVFLI